MQGLSYLVKHLKGTQQYQAWLEKFKEKKPAHELVGHGMKMFPEGKKMVSDIAAHFEPYLKTEEQKQEFHTALDHIFGNGFTRLSVLRQLHRKGLKHIKVDGEPMTQEKYEAEVNKVKHDIHERFKNLRIAFKLGKVHEAGMVTAGIVAKGISCMPCDVLMKGKGPSKGTWQYDVWLQKFRQKVAPTTALQALRQQTFHETSSEGYKVTHLDEEPVGRDALEQRFKYLDELNASPAGVNPYTIISSLRKKFGLNAQAAHSIYYTWWAITFADRMATGEAVGEGALDKSLANIPLNMQALIKAKKGTPQYNEWLQKFRAKVPESQKPLSSSSHEGPDLPGEIMSEEEVREREEVARPVSQYKDSLQEFLTKQGRNDIEEGFISLVKQYHDNPEHRNSSSRQWSDYLTRLARENAPALASKGSKEFLSELEKLTNM